MVKISADTENMMVTLHVLQLSGKLSLKLGLNLAFCHLVSFIKKIFKSHIILLFTFQPIAMYNGRIRQEAGAVGDLSDKSRRTKMDNVLCQGTFIARDVLANA